MVSSRFLRQCFPSPSLLAAVLFLHFSLSAEPVCSAPKAEASGKKAPQIKLMPVEVKRDALPAPGHPMILKVKLPGIRDVGLLVRALVIRDGKLTEISSSKADQNDFEDAVYEFSVPAPLAELSYQFMLRNADGTGTITARKSVSRQCVPRVELTEVIPLSKIKGDMEDKLISLVAQAKSLEKDVAAYEKAVLQIEELRKLLKED